MIPRDTDAAEELARLQRLRSLAVLDSEPEAIFEQATRLAADLCGTPISLISLIDADRQWFKSNIGLQGVSQTPRNMAICSEACRSDELLEIRDASQDSRFASNPLVTGDPCIRFYAGAPIVMPAGERVGALCVIDRVPRHLDAVQRTALTGLSRLVATALLEREGRVRLVGDLAHQDANYRTIVEGQSELISLADLDGRLIFVNLAYARFFGQRPEDMVGRSLLDFVDRQDRDAVATHLLRVVEEGALASDANRMVRAQGDVRWVAWTNRVVRSNDGAGRAIHSVGRDITEQRAAERALAQTEARHRMLYESTPAMLHSINPTGHLLNVSDIWLQTLGYERHEVVGRALIDFMTPQSQRLATEEVLPMFFETGRCRETPYEMVRKDGSVMDVLLSAVLERDADGKPVRSLTVMQDVTEKNATAAALDETTRRLQLVLDGLTARVSYWDCEHRNLFANRAFLASFGVTQQAITGQHAKDVMGTGWYELLRRHIETGLAGQEGQMEAPYVSPEGKRRDLELHFTPDRRDDQVHGLIVFALDVTERREAERELVERERRFKLLIDGVPDYAIYMLDAQGHVATWNAGAERNKGYHAEHVVGQHFRLFFTPEDVAAGRPERQLAQAAREGRFETEAWRVRADGSRFWAGVLLSPIHDDAGALLGYAKVTRDLTEQRRQREIIEQAMAEKDTLLKEVYHRVKNNLQVVQSLLNLQSQMLPEGTARSGIDDSVQRVRAMALVHEKLYQSGNLAAVSLRLYIKDLLEQLADVHGADRRKLRMHTDIADVQTGLDNAVPLGLLLTELVTNCLKHAFVAGQGGDIRVSLVRRADGDLLTIADNGVGLPPGFEAAAQTTSLGLQLADGLTRQLGGELRARTEGGAVMSALLARL